MHPTPLQGAGIPVKTPSSTPPLARSVAPVALDWDGVEPQDAPRPADALGLSAEDRAALGLSMPRTIDLAPHAGGDAQAALAEVLARGAAYGKQNRPAPRKQG